jgi:choline dehydrogenase
METFDYVIIGAGSAGSVLANRLSEDPTVSVCVLEAGPKDWHPYIHLPAGFIKTTYDPRVNWCYTQEEGAYTGGRRVFAPRGKTLGGSSSINGHIYNRGLASDFDTWAQLGNRGWGYSDILPYFKRMERRIGNADETYRGREGPLTVTESGWRHPLADAFVESCLSIGMPRAKDYNGASQAGVTYAQRAIHNGRRVSAARAFLKPAMRRPNLRIITHAHVTSLLLEGKRATGAAYRVGGRGGPAMEVKARREVLLSGGAYNSPQLLMLSGIGPPQLLQSLGIPVRHALAGVGEGLQDHYTSRVVAKVKNVTTINEMVRGPRLVGEALKYAFGRTGVLSLQPSIVLAFWHSGETPGPDPDLQFIFTPGSYKEGQLGRLEDHPGMTCAGWQHRPESRGFVRLASSDPFQAPIIQSNYLDHELDRRVFISSIKISRRLLSAAPFAPYLDREEYPGAHVQSDDEILAAGVRNAQTVFHPASTCRMGPASVATNVVDDQLRVHGLEGLRVVDASVMPRMISANLNASVLMIADKASDLIRGRPAPEPAVLPA